MKRNVTVFIALIFIFCFLDLSAAIKENIKSNDGKTELQTPTGLFDLQSNSKSNFSFYTTNYGIFGLNVSANKGGGYWPRGSQNEYIFASGFWFGCLKNDGDTMRKMVEASYNPNNGRSWFVPGRIEDGDSLITSDLYKYRIYFSPYFNLWGEPFDSKDGPNWPLWNNKNNTNDKYGTFVNDITNRNIDIYPEGPAFISDEDIYTTYKDADLNYYDGGVAYRKSRGYPLHLQYEQTIYSWAKEQYKDMIVMYYKVINKSNETIYNCWFSPVIDMDIAIGKNPQQSATNDRVRFYDEDPSLNLAIGWTNTQYGEAGQGFGYIGMSFIMSPVVDNDGYAIDDVSVWDSTKQIGMTGFRNWNIANDPKEDFERYDFMSAQVKDGDTGEGDKRVLFSTGPFNLAPGKSARVGILINFAPPVGGSTKKDSDNPSAQNKESEANGSTANVANLINEVKKARKYFYGSMATSIAERETRLNQTGIAISEPYPNPSSDEARLDMFMKEGGYVSIEIDNLMGQKVIPLISKYYSPGMNQINFDLQKLPAGQYYIKINNGSKIFTKLLTVLK
jgi:hypothetical protein